MSDQYYPIRLNTLRFNESVSFDVFLKVGERFIHYTRIAEEVEGDRLLKLKGKGVRKLFILAEAEDLYLKYLEAGLNKLQRSDLSLIDRANLAHDSLVTAAENAERTLETEAGYQNQKRQIDLISDFLNGDKKALKEVLVAAGVSTDTNIHAATVSSMALAVGGKLGLGKEDLFELGTAALLHDIGKNRLKFDPMKLQKDMTATELKAYKNHPQDGADMLAGKPYISPRILGLIAAHEERGQGRGYPDKKDISKLPAPYQILSLVNQFDHYCIENKISATEAIDPFYDTFGHDYDDALLTILATVLT